MELKGDHDEDECRIKEVDVTVPKTDDPNMPVLTFRMWVLGVLSCMALSLVNQFFWYRTQSFGVSSTVVQIAVVPIGHLMARTLPTRAFFRGTWFEFSMNPGPFNVKEHVLISIFADSGVGSVYAIRVLSAVKLLYKKPLPFLPAFLVILTTQVLGFGCAGLFRKFLVDPEEMWWPSNLAQVSLFRALHEKEERAKGSTTRNQFFILVLVTSFAYCLLSTYLFTLLASLSWVCWLGSKSTLLQQLGSGYDGLGLGSFGLDWGTISSAHESPLVSPWFATANVVVGFFLIMYVMIPFSYWLNVYNAKNFPIFSSKLFMGNGSLYDISRIVDSQSYLDESAYSKNGSVHLSIFFAMTYGLGFAAFSATVVHVLLFHASDIWNQGKRAFRSSKRMDIHTRLMKKYKSVPMWWFFIILIVNIALAIFACQYYNASLQLPWWGVIPAFALALFFTLPIAIILATTNQQPDLNIIIEYITGYMYPERPIANMCFKTYVYNSIDQALIFLQNFKLGHYMKIAPRVMFMIQVVGTLIAVFVYTITAWWLMGTIPNLCDTTELPPDSPWTCPMDNVFYDASVISGLLGPRRMFGSHGEYRNLTWFFLGGAVAPIIVWLAHKAFPSVKWIPLIHMPVLLGATSKMPPATAVNFTSWIICGFLSGYVAYRYRPKWWERYNYVLSGGLDAGTSFMVILLFLALGDTRISWWGNNGEGCPLATCPTAPGIVVDGCPVH